RKVTQEELLARRVPVSESERALNQALKFAGTNATGSVEGRFVVVGEGDSNAEMGRLAAKAERFYSREYGLFLPSSMVTIHLAPSISGLRKLGNALHGFNLPDQCIGYSQQDDLTLVVISSGGTLCHELFHLM